MVSILKIGLIINPIAGIAGRVGLKGSDSIDIQEQAILLGAVPESVKRSAQALACLETEKQFIQFYTVKGPMGQELLHHYDFNYEVVFAPEDLNHTTAEDTINAAHALVLQGVDLILFSGGDGTAINILNSVGETQPCLGIPTGCKIYSGVFGITPELTAAIIIKLIHGGLVDLTQAQVLDINEDSFRNNHVTTKVHGEMCIPLDGKFVQAVKTSGIESEDIARHEISVWIVENMESEQLYLIGSGRTCFSIKEELGVDGSLLGVDAVIEGQMIQKDASESELMTLIEQYQPENVRIILSFIGGQGILLGRGNHQVCHKVIRCLGKDRLIVVSTKTKVKALEGQALYVDTGDAKLNNDLTGYVEVITGYEDRILYPIGANYSG